MTRPDPVDDAVERMQADKMAIDEADPEPRSITALLDVIPGAWEGAERGRADLQAGLGVPLEDL